MKTERYLGETEREFSLRMQLMDDNNRIESFVKLLADLDITIPRVMVFPTKCPYCGAEIEQHFSRGIKPAGEDK